MAVLDLDGLAEASQLVARAAIQQVRQVASTGITSAAVSATSLGLSSLSTSTPSPTGTLASSIASATSTGSINSGNGSTDGNNSSGTTPATSGQSSPLLFFVALGFGVVFTNLWIIVGVKYCFRYNARNRQLRGEDGQPITLEQLPVHPRRRRREKKLMSIEEVNEKFPMTKYKTWVSSRAQEGLPTQGGVSVAPSRANSLREAEGIIAPKERDSVEERPGTSATIHRDEAVEAEKVASPSTTATTTTTAAAPSTPHTTATPTTTQTDSTTPITHQDTHEHDEDDKEDEEDVIATSVPTDLLNGSGDTCAICIDTLEDDDDIRGLTCGHAFHAVCLDPWLTSRRACCPLCKADYYTPKVRAQGADLGEALTVAMSNAAATGGVGPNMPSRPGVTWVGLRGRGAGPGGRMMMPIRFNNPLVVNESTPPAPLPYILRGRRDGPVSPTGAATNAPTSTTADAANTTDGVTGDPVEPVRWWNGSQLRMPRLGRRNRNQGQTATTTQPTPSNLEAGTA